MGGGGGGEGLIIASDQTMLAAYSFNSWYDRQSHYDLAKYL